MAMSSERQSSAQSKALTKSVVAQTSSIRSLAKMDDSRPINLLKKIRCVMLLVDLEVFEENACGFQGI